MHENTVARRARPPRDSAEGADRARPEPVSALTEAVEQLLSETKLSFSQAAQEFDRSVGSVVRWAVDGVLGRSRGGVRHREWLEHFRLGGKLYTTREALARFVVALGGADPIPRSREATDSRTPSERRRADAQAAREAERLGC